MAAKGGRIDFMFLGPPTRPLDPLLLLPFCPRTIPNIMPRAVFANYTLKVNDLAFLDVVHELFCCPHTETFILNMYCTIQSVHIHEYIFASLTQVKCICTPQQVCGYFKT